MKKLFAMFMLFLFVVFAGCNSSTGDKKDDTGNNGNGGTLKVTGYVKLTSVEGVGIKDVSVKLTQSGSTISSVSTNTDGYFECVNIAAGTYVVTPTKSGYTFNPPTVANVTVVAADVAVQTIVGTVTGGSGNYTVSGSVKLNSASGAGIEGATVVIAQVSATPNPQTATTSSTGAFSFGNIAAGSYLVTVTKTGYTFLPEYVTVTVSNKNETVQTFVGTTVNTSGDAGTHSLFPLKTGNTWTYDSVTSISSFEINGSQTNEVKGTMVQGGKTYWSLDFTTYNSDNEEDSKDTYYLRIENNVLYTYGTEFFTAKVAPKAAKAAQALKKTASSDGDLAAIKFNVSAGTTWDIFQDSGSAQGNSYSIAVTGKYVGTETVGSYSNCAKYEIVYSSESSTTSIQIAAKWAWTMWFAPSVGIVKSTEAFSTGDTLATLALSNTITNTLRSSVIH
jgi:hypothetical protein